MLLEQAQALADKLTAGGVQAFVDPVLAQTKRPCVLVTLPARDFTTLATTWRLAALASTDAPSLKAFRELDELVEGVDRVLPVERAEPASYTLTSGAPPVPAYLCTVTT